MKCLDTDLLVAILRGKEEAKKKVAEQDEEAKGATTFVNACELFFQRQQIRKKRREC